MYAPRGLQAVVPYTPKNSYKPSLRSATIHCPERRIILVQLLVRSSGTHRHTSYYFYIRILTKHALVFYSDNAQTFNFIQISWLLQIQGQLNESKKISFFSSFSFYVSPPPPPTFIYSSLHPSLNFIPFYSSIPLSIQKKQKKINLIFISLYPNGWPNQFLY